MKRILFLSFGALCTLGLHSQTITILDEGAIYGGMMPQTISPNGKYVGGSTLAGMMFISEWADHNSLVIDESFGSIYDDFGGEIRGISDSGIGVGFDDAGAVIVDLPQQSYNLLERTRPSNGIKDVLANSITPDAKIIVGDIIGEGYNSKPVYWENSELHYLPLPDHTDFGFVPEGYSAQQITDDGSIIMGHAIDNFSTFPMVLWYRQEDGSYICDPVFKGYFEGGYGENEFLRFKGMSINGNGTSIIMKVQYNTTDPKLMGVNLLAMYSVKEKSLDVIHIDGEHGIPEGTDCDVWFNGISNNNTVVGWYRLTNGERYPFIMYPEELQPMKLSDAFPSLEKLKVFDESEEHALSGISADGRYLCGMGVDYSDVYSTYIYVGYVIDTKGDDAGVSSIGNESFGKEKYYGIDGLRYNELRKGLNILRYPDGTSKKVLIK